jgi:hypothetical protein
MQKIQSTNEIKNRDKFIKIPQYSSSSSIPFGYIGTDFPNIDQFIKTEFEKELIPIAETQKVLVNHSAELTLQIDSIKEEVNNLTKIYTENYQLKKKIQNINSINSFRKLSSNWNGYNAEPFNEVIIQKALDFINLTTLRFQPNVFPTAQKSIQFEYAKSNGNYLEIEVFENNIAVYSEINDEKKEFENISQAELLRLVNDFHTRF